MMLLTGQQREALFAAIAFIEGLNKLLPDMRLLETATALREIAYLEDEDAQEDNGSFGLTD
jgi:hypothetical protein